MPERYARSCARWKNETALGRAPAPNNPQTFGAISRKAHAFVYPHASQRHGLDVTRERSPTGRARYASACSGVMRAGKRRTTRVPCWYTLSICRP